MKRVTVFAPATVANVAVGFDILGFSFDCIGDRVTVERTDEGKNGSSAVIIQKMTGLAESIPFKSELNTATVGLLKMREDLDLKFEFKVSIHKGIPIGSGMGGSASSAVAAVVAANALLDHPLSKVDLLKYALEGESIAVAQFMRTILPLVYSEVFS
jgi:homoserine kinase